MIEKQDYLNKTYAGLIGMQAGMILGAQVEIGPWNSSNIELAYGNIENLNLYNKRFAADDDSNGPLFFIRSLIESEKELTFDNLKNTWLNYVRYEKGMFWWGPSTERKAYENLLNDIAPCKSGSVELNGELMCNQIGGQIFIDTWGMVAAGDLKLTKKLATMAAKISHDQNGIEGAVFIASCVSLAYIDSSAHNIVRQALQNISPGSEYSIYIQKALEMYEEGESFEGALSYLDGSPYTEEQDFGHIIPNAYICALSLLYGEGNLNKVISYATKAGWDTDCNGSNVGAISGIISGIDVIDIKYRNYINDTILTSSAIGSMNIVDVPNFTKLLWQLRKKLYGQNNEIVESRKYDFDLPHCTHGLESSSLFHANIIPLEKQGINVPINMLVNGNEVFIFKKTFYQRRDLVDERYSPVFSPILYPGESVVIKYSFNSIESKDVDWNNITAIGYIRLVNDEIIELTDNYFLGQNGDIKFKIPSTIKCNIAEFGIKLQSVDIKRNMEFGILKVEQIEILGKAKYEIDFSKQNIEFNSVTPYSHEGGSHYLDKYYFEHNGNETTLRTVSLDKTKSLAGYYTHSNYKQAYEVLIESGNLFNIYFYAQGLNRYNCITFKRGNAIIVSSYSNGIEREIEIEFPWNYNEVYKVDIIPESDFVKILVDNKEICQFKPNQLSGLHGYGFAEQGIARIFKVNIEVI